MYPGSHEQLPELPNALQQYFPVNHAVWGKHVTMASIDIGGVHIPSGFRTDFGSVPWLARWIVPTMGRALPAYLAHDYLYCRQTVSRSYADKLMLEIMRWYGFHWLRRTLAYWGVRLGGWLPWRRNAKQLADIGEAFDAMPPTRDEE